MWDDSLTNTWWHHLSPASDKWFQLTFQIGPTSVVVTAWWVLHILIHSRRRLSMTSGIFEMDVGAIPCVFRASSNAWWNHLSPRSHQWFQLTFQIGSHKCGGKSIKHDGGLQIPIHSTWSMSTPFFMLWVDVGTIPWWDESLNHCMMVSFVTW
jgi:hypothetical protein